MARTIVDKQMRINVYYVDYNALTTHSTFIL
jgi:hypothetical protein